MTPPSLRESGGQGPALRDRLRGVFAPISTPFDDSEEVDYEALERNMRTYAASGLLGYLVIGSNGENKSLTEDEKRRVLQVVIAAKAPGQVTIAGAIYEAQRDVERFLDYAAAAGADFGLVLPPSYFRRQMTDDVLFRFFTTLADTAPLPIMIYNAPGFTGSAVSVGLVGRLSAHPNIVGLKDSGRSGIEAFLAFESPEFHVLAGSIDFLLPAMMAGSLGGTVSLANAFPSIAHTLWRYGDTRDRERGSEYQEWCRKLNGAISGSHGVPGVKAAMTLAGLEGGIPRRPLLPLTQTEIASLRANLLEAGAPVA